MNKGTYSIESLPVEMQSAYWYYLEECNSERTLSPDEWLLWQQAGSGRAEDFLGAADRTKKRTQHQ